LQLPSKAAAEPARPCARASWEPRADRRCASLRPVRDGTPASLGERNSRPLRSTAGPCANAWVATNAPRMTITLKTMFFMSPLHGCSPDRQALLLVSAVSSPNVIPFLCVGIGRSLVLAPISNAGLLAAGYAPVTFRGYLGRLGLRVPCQFGSGVFSGEVGGR